MSAAVYDHVYIAELRELGWSWRSVAGRSIVYEGTGVTAKQLRQAHSRWLKRQKENQGEGSETSGTSMGSMAAPLAQEQKERAGHGVSDDPDLPLVTLGDEEAEARREQPAENGSSPPSPDSIPGYEEIQRWDKTPGRTVHLRKLPPDPRQEAILDRVMADWITDAAEHAPAYLPPRLALNVIEPGEEHMAVLALFDPHFGMLAWRHEVGHDYDLSIAVTDYARAVEGLLPTIGLYPVEKILYLVGNDFLHVDGPGSDARGNRRGGATTAGTAQDIEGRLAKMFTMGRRALVRGIDMASALAQVEVLVVPGNHDREQMYRMGEVLSAWYRNDLNVQVTFSPNKRAYHQYGANAFLFTHGEEARRKRDPLPLVMATEIETVLPGAWAASQNGNREIIMGHNHIGMAGGYYPTADLDETRGIRTRCISGMTPEDAWHHEESYKHHRAATLLMYKKTGGLSGFHEVNL